MNKLKKGAANGFGSFIIFFVAIVIIDWAEGSGTILSTIYQWWNSFD